MNEISGANYFGVSTMKGGKSVQRRIPVSSGHDTVSFGAGSAVKTLSKTKSLSRVKALIAKSIAPLAATAAIVLSAGTLRAEQPENATNSVIQGRQRVYAYPYLSGESASAIDNALKEGNLNLDETPKLQKEIVDYCRCCKEESEANPPSVWANVPIFSYFFEKPENPAYRTQLNEHAVGIASEVTDIHYPGQYMNLNHALEIAKAFDLKGLTHEQLKALCSVEDLKLQKEMFKNFLLENNGIEKSDEQITSSSQVENSNLNETEMSNKTLNLIKEYDGMIPEFQHVTTTTGEFYVIGYGTAFKPEEVGYKDSKGHFVFNDNVSKTFNIGKEEKKVEFSPTNFTEDIAEELALYHFLESKEHVEGKINVPVKNSNYLILPLEIAYLAGKKQIDKAPNMMAALGLLNALEPGTEAYNNALIEFVKEASDIGLYDTIEGQAADEGHFKRHIHFANLMLEGLGYPTDKLENPEDVRKKYEAERVRLVSEEGPDSEDKKLRKKAAHTTAAKYVCSVIEVNTEHQDG